MQLQDMHIAVIVTDGFEDSELMKPYESLKNAGAIVDIISDEPGTIQGKNGAEIMVDKTVDTAHAKDYDALLMPGGVANPDRMRTVEAAVNFVQDMSETHKPIAAICHAPWLLVEADVVGGRTVTSWPSLKTDLKNAGATWVDKEVVVDQGLVTSRNPDDIPAFIDSMIETFAMNTHIIKTM